MAISDTPTGSTAEDATDQAKRRLGTGLLATGGLLGALAASSCCIIPLALFMLGVSGAWIGNLTALAPYQPLFVVPTLGFLGAGFYLVYRRPKAVCADAPVCAQPASRRVVKTALWSATVLVAAAMAFPYYAPLLLGSY
jgi:mercuric ion transport protein